MMCLYVYFAVSDTISFDFLLIFDEITICVNQSLLITVAISAIIIPNDMINIFDLIHIISPIT